MSENEARSSKLVTDIIGEMRVKLTVEAVEQSPALRELVREIIKEELAHLDDETATRLATQVTRRMVKAASTR